ncbi:MAG: GGDEF domain-containing protein [Labilithrix sp.]|nr:GGDEF domain-containing protein [Labilithrix sp.]
MSYPKAAWQLIHDDPFDRVRTDADVEGVVASFAARTATPYAEVLRRLVGLEEISEDDARAFFGQVLEHRRGLATSLEREVHLRVAALDLLTLRPPRKTLHSGSHPIIVTSALLEKALEEASADPVTGLPQRAHFMSLVSHELRQRRRRKACVAFIDLDRFKNVNDAYGHAAGDEVLRALGAAAREVLRQGDVIARIGGDEFAVLVLDALPDEANAAVERLRDRFEALTRPFGTSFSAGIAVATQGESPESLLMRADGAMYRQKRARAAASG